MVKLKLKLRRVKKIAQTRLDVTKLKDPALKKAFQLEIRNRLSVLDIQQELHMEVFNQSELETGENILGS